MSDQAERRALVARRNRARSRALAGVSLVGWVGYVAITGHVVWTPAAAVIWFGYLGWVAPR